MVCSTASSRTRCWPSRPRFLPPRSGAPIFKDPPQELFRECSHYCEPVSDTAQLPYVLENAIRAASETRCGGAGGPRRPRDAAAPKRGISPNAGLLRRHHRSAGRSLTDRCRPLERPRPSRCSAGALCRRHDASSSAGRSRAHLARLGARACRIRQSLRRRMTGFIGFSDYAPMHACDVLLMLGLTSLQAVSATDARSLRSISGRDLRPSLQALISPRRRWSRHIARCCKAHRETERKHLDDSLAHYKKARGLDQLARGTFRPKTDPAAIPRRLLSEKSSDDAVMSPPTSDAHIWAAAIFQMNGRRRLSDPGSTARCKPMAHAIGVQAVTAADRWCRCREMWFAI